ncbi:hypothetical protein [Variovorax sp. EL159]|uniref:hypothetical protein n=1 Tax=Variovorax sp. EL159 TaxID=1566270 RepID=UPI00088A82E8|nr:hypothetical protein [Variovorax sp. EL159]SCX73138.1 hypothetical protein SAMN03159363_4864 [Variovorax sp. EL159]
MGLAISVGTLAYLLENDTEGAEWRQEELAVANKLLASADLPPHAEPRELPPLHSRASLRSFPYSYIHYLRLAYAYRAQSPDWMATPLPDGVDPTDDPVVEDALFDSESHLIRHSDADGFYVPVDFEEVLYSDPDDEKEVVGGMLGSSYRLRDELVLVAPALGITLVDGQLSDEEAKRINGLVDVDEGLHREYASWLLLYEAARLSIAHKMAIVFN